MIFLALTSATNVWQGDFFSLFVHLNYWFTYVIFICLFDSCVMRTYNFVRIFWKYWQGSFTLMVTCLLPTQFEFRFVRVPNCKFLLNGNSQWLQQSRNTMGTYRDAFLMPCPKPYSNLPSRSASKFQRNYNFFKDCKGILYISIYCSHFLVSKKCGGKFDEKIVWSIVNFWTLLDCKIWWISKCSTHSEKIYHNQWLESWV